MYVQICRYNIEGRIIQIVDPRAYSDTFTENLVIHATLKILHINHTNMVCALSILSLSIHIYKTFCKKPVKSSSPS